MDIGLYTISTFETGDFALDGGAMFGVVPKTLWMKAYHTGDDHNRIDMTARSLLIRGNGRIILVDTGCGHKMAEKLANIYRLDYSRASIEQSLQSHGITPEEITDVVLTHLHFDHVGGATKKYPMVISFQHFQMPCIMFKRNSCNGRNLQLIRIVLLLCLRTGIH